MKTALALLLLAALAATAAPGGATAAPASAPAASVRLVACEEALEPAGRFMVAEGRMRGFPDAARLQIRFDLQVRTPDRRRFTPVRGPGFGVWNTAEPAPRQFVYRKRVEALLAPAAYRMAVRFRWSDARGRRLASTIRLSPVCEQPDLRPDLVPLRVQVTQGPTPDTSGYRVPVRNAGATAAEPFAVTLAVAGRLLPAQLLAGADPGERVVASWTGPRCPPGETLVVRADADGAVDEADESDNGVVAACPG